MNKVPQTLKNACLGGASGTTDSGILEICRKGGEPERRTTESARILLTGFSLSCIPLGATHLVLKVHIHLSVKTFKQW